MSESGGTPKMLGLVFEIRAWTASAPRRALSKARVNGKGKTRADFNAEESEYGQALKA